MAFYGDDASSVGKKHYYMCLITMVYTRKVPNPSHESNPDEPEMMEVTGQRSINIVAENSKPIINYPMMHAARNNAIERMRVEMNVNPDDIKDLFFSDFSYLGKMTQKELKGTDNHEVIRSNRNQKKKPRTDDETPNGSDMH